MNTALLVDAVVRDGDIHVTDPLYKTRRQRYARKVGEGVCLRIRIEPEDEAYTYGQIKHYYGHLISPVSEFTGETKADVHLRMKALYMPDGKTSLTELNREQMESYIESVSQHLREEIPEAWERSVEKTSLYH